MSVYENARLRMVESRHERQVRTLQRQIGRLRRELRVTRGYVDLMIKDKPVSRHEWT